MISSKQLGIIRSLDVHVRRELNPDMVNSTLFQQCSNTSSGVHGGILAQKLRNLYTGTS